MGMTWKVEVVPIEDAKLGLGNWEPFAVVEDEDVGPCVVVKGYFHTEDDEPQSSTKHDNRAGNEPDHDRG